MAEAGAGGGREGGGGRKHGGEEVGEDGAGEGVLGAVAGDGVQEGDGKAARGGGEEGMDGGVRGEEGSDVNKVSTKAAWAAERVMEGEEGQEAWRQRVGARARSSKRTGRVSAKEAR